MELVLLCVSSLVIASKFLLHLEQLTWHLIRELLPSNVTTVPVHLVAFLSGPLGVMSIIAPL